MYKEIIEKIKPELDKTLEFFSKELSKIRTGQASPALVEDVLIDAFDQKMVLKQLAAITVPDRRQIVIQPWDTSYLEPIEKALQNSQIGISPIVDKDIIRINLPPLTQEFRQMLLKVLGEKAEETKKTLRHWREEAWNEIQDKTRKGEIREDDKFRGKDELQKVIDEYTKKVDELVERKTNEIQID